MRMPEKRQSAAKVRKARLRLRDIGYVFVLVARRAMPDLERIEQQRSAWQLPQIFELAAVQMLSRPEGRRLRDFVKPFQAIDAGHPFVVIPANHRAAVRPRPFENFGRMRIVAHQIAAADNVVEVSACVGQHRLQPVDIRMRVADDQSPHRG